MWCTIQSCPARCTLNVRLTNVSVLTVNVSFTSFYSSSLLLFHSSLFFFSNTLDIVRYFLLPLVH